MTRQTEEKMDTRIVENDTIKYKITRKKSNEWIRNTIAFVVALAIVGLCLHLNSFRSARISNNSIRNLKYKNQTVDDSVWKKIKKSQLPHRRNQFLGDAMWTMEPTFLENQNSQSQTNDENINKLIDRLNKHDNLNEKNNKGKTTPTHTDKPTTPVTTSSDTTPAVTDKPTTPITTVSVTTPIVTEPGGDPFITTEAPPAQDDDPNETMKLIRMRRQVVGATVTTPDPDSTTTDATNECAEGSYRGASGRCQCPNGQGGSSCQSAMNATDAAQQSANTVTITASAMGDISNMNRADFQNEMENLLPDNVDRVFVEFNYNNETNTTTVTFSVILDEPADPDNINAVSGQVANVAANITNFNVDGQPVHFAAAHLIVEAGESGETEAISLGATASMGVCDIFDTLVACGNASRGMCIGVEGEPRCTCRPQFVGRYCNEPVQWSPASQEDETMDILLPIIGAVAGALMLCSCCFFIILRRKSKGVPDLSETESVSTSYPIFPKSSSIILPRFHTKSFWKEVGPSNPMEEIFEVYSVVSAEEEESVSDARVYREEPVMEVVTEQVVEEVIETESVSSDTLSSYPGTSSYIQEYEPLPAGSVQSDYSMLPRLRPDNL